MRSWFATQDYGVSIARLWAMRVVYFITGVLFGVQTWSTLIADRGTFEPLEGVAFAFWGGLSILMLVGLRFPMKMLPILLMQFIYKLIWVLFVGLPLVQAGLLDDFGQEMMNAMAMGAVIDLIAIPWIYVARNYVLAIFKPGTP